MSSSESTSLRSEPLFVRWAAAEGVSLVGTAVTTVVLPLVVYDITGSAAQTGLLFAFRVVPYLLFGLVAGPLADRGNRRRLIIGGNAIEGVLIATIPIAHALGVLTIAQIYAVSLLSATAFVFSDAAVFGAVPALVGARRLAAANGFLSSMASMADIIGPVIAGVLVATVGATSALWIDAGSFLAAVVVQSTIRSTFRDPVAGRSGSVSVRAQIGRAVGFVRTHRVVATLLICGFGNSFAFGAVLGLLVPYASERLGLDGDDARIGVLYGALGVGSLIAGATFARIFRTERIRWLTPLTLLVSGVLAFVLAVVANWLAAAAAVLLFSLSMTLTIMIGITYRQLVAPDDLRSSVNVIGRMISWGGQPFGAAAGALLTTVAPIEVAYAAAAVVMLVSGIGAAIAFRVPTPHA